jgi:pimeloyl-ACP methyl ester carboxylesterase
MTESGFIEVEGARLYYEVEGSGHPLLMIHGGLGDLRMWDGQVPAFAERYRVIRYDTRGFGRIEVDDVEYSNLEDARAVLDHLDVPSAYLVGTSRGGIIGLDFLLAYPGRVDAFVSVASGVGGYQADPPEDTSPPWDEMERLWEAKDWEQLAELETQTWVDGWGNPKTRIDPELRSRVKGWIVENYRAEKDEGEPQPAKPPAAERLGEVRVPVLVLVGDADEAGTVAGGRHLAASVDGAELVEFPGVAHMIHLEEPERVNQLVLEFLGAVDATRGRDSQRPRATSGS